MRFLIVISVLLISNFANCQTINWHERKLTTNDFTIVDQLNGNHSAEITASIRMESKYNKGLLKVKVESILEKPDGLKRKPGDFPPKLLQHEQLHFDINELHTRILKKRIMELNLTLENIKDIYIVYDKVSEEKKLMNKLYDFETNHSLNTEKQLYWNKKIQQELLSLIQYAPLNIYKKVIN